MKTKSIGSNKQVLIDTLSEPLRGATAAKFDIHTDNGNLTIDKVAGGEQVLVSGTLEYLGNQGSPVHNLDTNSGLATFTLKESGRGKPGFRFPWAACNGATGWQIHLNPDVRSDIKAYSGGGNVRLDLSGMAVSNVSADTGGGNMEVVLPDNAANLNVTASSGAGNVTVEIGRGTAGSNIINASSGAGNVIVRVPAGLPARIHTAGRLGKGLTNLPFSKIDDHTVQSPDYDGAVDKIDIEVKSGLGEVAVHMV